MWAQVVLLVQLGRLATGFLVQRATVEIQAPQGRSVPKEMAIPAPRARLVCLDFQENPALRDWASLDQRGMLVSEGCQVCQDLRAKASRDLRVTQAGLALKGHRGHKDKEFKDQRVSRGPRV